MERMTNRQSNVDDLQNLLSDYNKLRNPQPMSSEPEILEPIADTTPVTTAPNQEAELGDWEGSVGNYNTAPVGVSEEIDTQQEVEQQVADEIINEEVEAANKPTAEKQQEEIITDQVMEQAVESELSPRDRLRQTLQEAIQKTQLTDEDKSVAQSQDLIKSLLSGVGQQAAYKDAGATARYGGGVNPMITAMGTLDKQSDYDRIRQEEREDLQNILKQYQTTSLADARSDTAKARLASAQAALQSSPEKELTKGQIAADKEFGKEFAKSEALGDKAKTESTVDSLENVIQKMRNNPDAFGGATAYLGSEKLIDLLNPALSTIKQRLEKIIQEDLRKTLGAQFTEREGKQFLERSFNPRLSAKENVDRTRQFLKMIKDRQRYLERASKLFRETGSISGLTADNARVEIKMPDGRHGTIYREELDKFKEKNPNAQVME